MPSVPKKNPAIVYLSRWPESSDTRRTMRAALNHVAHQLGANSAVECDWAKVKYEHAVAIGGKLLEEGLAVATVNKALVAFRGVLEVAWRTGAMSDDAYRRIKIQAVRGSSLAAGRALEDTDLDALEEALDKVSPRDAALVVVLFACGLRRIEAVRLRREDYDPQVGLRAMGKGNKERLVPLAGKWVPYFEKHWRTIRPGQKVFCAERRQQLSRDGLSHIIRQFCKTAGVSFRPHDLRRTFATRLLRKGVDLLTVKRLMGHASADTTGRYDLRGEAEARDAVEGLDDRKKTKKKPSKPATRKRS